MVQGEKEEVMVSGERIGDAVGGDRVKRKASNCVKLSGEINTFWLWPRSAAALPMLIFHFIKEGNPVP